MPDTENSIQNGGIPELTMTLAVADTVQAPVDATLTVSGKAADAKVTGNRLAALSADVADLEASNSGKVNKPSENPNGTAGQLLRTNGDGTTEWSDVGTPTDEQTESAVSAWLTAHPEATTTVEDNSISRDKLNSDLKEKTDGVPVLKDILSLETGAVIAENWQSGKIVIPNKGETISSLTPEETSNIICQVVPCAGAEAIAVNIYKGSVETGYCFLDENNVVLDKSKGGGVVEKSVVDVPENAVKFVINNSVRYMPTGYYCVVGKTADAKIDDGLDAVNVRVDEETENREAADEAIQSTLWEEKNALAAALTGSVEYTLMIGTGINATDGKNANNQPNLARTGMNPIPSQRTVAVTVLHPDYEFIVWTYTDDATPNSAAYSPTNNQYTSGWATVPYTGNEECFRVGFRRKDIAILTSIESEMTDEQKEATDEYKLLSSIRLAYIPETQEKAFFTALNQALSESGGSFHPYLRQGKATVTDGYVADGISLTKACTPSDALIFLKKGDYIQNDGLVLSTQLIESTVEGSASQKRYTSITGDFYAPFTGLWHVSAQNVDSSVNLPVAEAIQKITVVCQEAHAIYDLPANPYAHLATVIDAETNTRQWASRIKDIKSTTHLHTSMARNFRRAVAAGYDHLAISNYHASVPTVPIADVLPTLPSYDPQTDVVPDGWVESPNAEHVYFTDAIDYLSTELGRAHPNHLHFCSVGSYLATGMEGTIVGSGGYEGTVKQFSREAEMLLQYANGGGITINHPIYSNLAAEDVIKLLSLGNVFGMEVYHLDGSGNLSVADTLWDEVLSKGWQIFGVGVPDHSFEGTPYSNVSGQTHPPFGFVHLLCTTKSEQEILIAYRNGRFYTTIRNDGLTLKYYGINDTGLVTFKASRAGNIKFVTASRTVTVESAASATFQTNANDGYVRAEIESVNDETNVANRLFTNAIML